MATLVITLLIDEVIFPDQQRKVGTKSELTKNVRAQLDRLDNKIDNVANKAIVDLNRQFNRFDADGLFPHFIFADKQLIYWSTNRFVPKYGSLDGSYLYRYVDLKSGRYLVKRRVLRSANNQIVEIFGFLPLLSRVPIDDHFTQSGLNIHVFNKLDFSISSDANAQEENKVYAKEGIYLFSFEGPSQMKVVSQWYQLLIFSLYLLAIISFVIGIYTYARTLVQAMNPFSGFLVFSIGLIILRLALIYYEFPLSIIDLALFDPGFYAASWWQPSLGDLFLNQLMLLAIIVFAYQLSSKEKIKVSGWKKEVLLISLYALGLVAFAHHMYELRSLLQNSQWTIDVAEDLQLSSFKAISYLIVFLNGVIYFLIAQRGLDLTGRTPGQKKYYVLALSFLTVLGLLVSFYSAHPFWPLLFVHSLYYLVVLVLELPKQVNQVSYHTFLYFFLAAFIIAFSCTYVLVDHIKQKDIQDKISLATELLSENDITAEYLLSEAGKNIENDILIQTNISSPFSSKELIRQKVKRSYLGTYFDKYDIKILLFNGKGNAIHDASTPDYKTLMEMYATPNNLTGYERLYFLKTDFPTPSSQYYLFSEVKRYGTTIGYVVVWLNKKQQLSNSIVPQLLLEAQPAFIGGNRFDYAFYKKGKLEKATDNFNYPRDFQLETTNKTLLFNKGISVAGYRHLGVSTYQDDEFYVISSPLYPLQYIITNFSVFFLFLVIIIILVFFISALFYNPQKRGISISAKIQLLLNFAFFLPLIIVSAVVLRLVNDTVKRNIETEYLNVTESAGKNLTPALQNFLNDRHENNEALESRIEEISQYTQSDINLFNPNGKLIATNQRLIFDNQILSTYINPLTMASLVEIGNNKLLFDEYLGDRAYKATYYGIRSAQDKRLLGILSMPFFESEDELQQQQTQILSDILNAFTFIFIIFVVLSFLASRVLTYPFKFLTQKIKTTTLSKYNEPLEWRADDEIGLMVKEYNRMLENLEKSKQELARSEKESAWREMAQQVAHEIKNPLTPMKLKLQHLKRVLVSVKAETGEDYHKPIDGLLNQVETLSDIATSFSSFAKMPVPISERMDLAATLKDAVGLFKADHAHITNNIPRSPVWIEGDQKLLGRIFNNLILNAIQSVPKGTKPELSIEVQLTAKKARVCITDNGSGIPEDIRDKIFIPKFSTKEEGSGIGLAIAKRGVEHAGGSIWFESNLGKGTTFYLEFPLTN